MADYMQDGEKSEELTKIGNIAADLQMDEKMRTQAINILGDMASHESLLVLLNLVANDKLHVPERELALKRAREIVKKGR